jgi:hypothetical protein
MDAFKEIDERLALLVGQYVWLVRRGVGIHLRMEFGVPHRRINERVYGSGMSARRLISIRGDISFWVQESQWSICAHDTEVNWKTDEASAERIIRYLNGQKVVSAVRGPDETVLEFDLGTTLRLGKSVFPTDMESVLWSLLPWQGAIVGVLNSGAAFVGESYDGDEPEPGSDRTSEK